MANYGGFQHFSKLPNYLNAALQQIRQWVFGGTADISIKSVKNKTHMDLLEITTPATPPANTLRLFVEDFKGFSFYSFIDSTGMVRKIVRDSVFVGQAAENITIGQVVYASGSSGNIPLLSLAKANDAATMPAIGIAIEAITSGAKGRVMQVGLIENINTNAFTEGNVLYVSAATAGALVATAPTYPNIRQEIGTVLVKGVGNGALQIVARSVFNDALIDHGGLIGIADDDHTQYLLADGTRALAGAWDMGSQALTNVNVDGGAIDGTPIGANSASTGKFTTIQATGAEALKVYTYTHTLTAQNITDTYCDITITAVTLANVRMFSCNGYDVGSNLWSTSGNDHDAGGFCRGRMTSTTNVRVYFGTDFAASDIIMVTIMEA
jgi:hypothetical protein